jgi:ketosteroid isomerase-like protein
VILLSAASFADSEREIAKTLDAFHGAAATADLDSYLGLTTEDVVFLGTDGSERWQGRAFREFVQTNFEAGRGWVYTPVSRNIVLAADGNAAWFDESLRHASLGRCRGSGVMVKSGEGWRIAQYNLSVPVPNEMVEQVVADIAEIDDEAAAAIGAAAADSPAVEQVAEPPPRPECRKKRHKTNRKAGC